jgi:hypothetical protein
MLLPVMVMMVVVVVVVVMVVLLLWRVGLMLVHGLAGSRSPPDLSTMM